MVTRINTLAKTDQHISKNLQNAVSFAQSQVSALESASKIIDRMAQLAGLATNSLISDSDLLVAIKKNSQKNEDNNLHKVVIL